MSSDYLSSKEEHVSSCKTEKEIADPTEEFWVCIWTENLPGLNTYLQKESK
jgi:hypothetical protein